MLHLVSDVILSLIVATILIKLGFIGYYGFLKNNQIIEQSFLFLFSKASIRNSFYKPLTRFMRLSNRLTIVFYLLAFLYAGVKVFELIVLR